MPCTVDCLEAVLCQLQAGHGMAISSAFGIVIALCTVYAMLIVGVVVLTCVVLYLKVFHVI